MLPRSGQTAPSGVDFSSAHRSRLRRMVALRLDQRLRGRIDPSDVIQEAFLEATERRPEYARQPDPMPPFLWLRFLTLQRLQIVHRQQLGTKSRDAASRGLDPRRSLSRGELGSTRGTASGPRHPGERRGHPCRATSADCWKCSIRMDAIDREVLVLRHFEQLTNGECARVLGLGESAATKRYLRALDRLKDILSDKPGEAEGGLVMNGGSTAPPDDDPLGPVVESFLDRFRRGERPALTELMARHPELAGRIRELIPALVELEQLSDVGRHPFNTALAPAPARVRSEDARPVSRAAG